MSSVDTRPPLRLTHSEATNWMSLHSEDVGRRIIVMDWAPADASSGPWPPRLALGYDAQGQWVWADGETA